MKLFRIKLDTNIYQRFLPVDEGIWEKDDFKLNCSSKLSVWKAPEIYVFNPKLKRGNFTRFGPGGFIIDETVLKKLRGILEWSSELLPLVHEGEPLWLVNVLDCVNCLDESKTDWKIGKTTQARIGINQYQFFETRFSESTLFKIPQTAAIEVLTISGIKDPEDEFKSIVDKEKLTGINFEPIWSS